MALRSFLFVPGDSERKLARGLASGADALILDLEDAVAPARKPLAQGMVADAETFVDTYRAVHAGGASAIVSVHLSGEISGTVDAARSAAARAT